MTKLDFSTIAYNLAFTSGALATGIWWVFKHGVKNVLKEERESIREIKHEVQPNSGGSLNDAIRKEVIPMLYELKGAFEQHIKEHNA